MLASYRSEDIVARRDSQGIKIDPNYKTSDRPGLIINKKEKTITGKEDVDFMASLGKGASRIRSIGWLNLKTGESGTSRSMFEFTSQVLKSQYSNQAQGVKIKGATPFKKEGYVAWILGHKPKQDKIDALLAEAKTW